MSIVSAGPEAQDSLFANDKSVNKVPQKLERAQFRLEFPPSYAIVGVYRLITDPTLYKPAWDKCRHGTIRGFIVGLIWVSAL
jgi:hypothetical protein